MKKKPLLRYRRFFNNHTDSVTIRIKSVLKSFCTILKQKMRRSIPQEFYHVSKDWKATVQTPETSIEPTITWIGHATFLIQIGGLNILTDPIFYEFFLKFFFLTHECWCIEVV